MDKSGQGMPTFGYIEPLNKSMVSPFLFFSLCVSATKPRQGYAHTWCFRDNRDMIV